MNSTRVMKTADLATIPPPDVEIEFSPCLSLLEADVLAMVAAAPEVENEPPPN